MYSITFWIYRISGASEPVFSPLIYVDWLLQKIGYSSALAMDLRLSCNSPSKWGLRNNFEVEVIYLICQPLGDFH